MTFVPVTVWVGNIWYLGFFMNLHLASFLKLHCGCAEWVNVMKVFLFAKP